MGETTIPDTLPNCELIRQLANKAALRKDTDFDFLGTLDTFRRRVSGEVRYINALFPEYTPHDEEYHLTRLFHVADTVLGTDRLEEMNSAELFVLAVGLYGHDWGMAVSEPEKQFILTGAGPENTNSGDLWILPDEGERLARFRRDHQLSPDADTPIERWREYVRTTHAFRSAERVRRFFVPIDGGVADAASRACEGHWIDFEKLQDYRSYPPDLGCLGETINLRAVTVYLRLIDVLDLAEDRTPYVIWKFVAPRDPQSRMEWQKHRALRPVTCPPYQEGRVIRVDGSTDDHEVYAALEDLHTYVLEQFRGCSDTLARMNDPRHNLDLYHVDWRVAPRGFKPISIQFDFDRDRMFEILGDEIYQGDSYVFLRELLQNSIDAIRMRREVLKRRNVDPRELGAIRVDVEQHENADAVVTWSDDGIGMDEHIVRNYLAVAGNSYYQSSEFAREGLKLDPISRFGVGILSCFMVASRIEIETFKDPYFPPATEPLRIIIPDARRRFRIEARSPESAQVGTTIRVFVEANKLPQGQDGAPPDPLRVARYLTELAGFVEFPIVVNEGTQCTVILHPTQDARCAQRFAQRPTVHQLDLSYPWEHAFLPQDLAAARRCYVEQSFDLSAQSSLSGYGGRVSFVVPASSDPPTSVEQTEGAHDPLPASGPEQGMTAPRPARAWDTERRAFAQSQGISPSVRHLAPLRVYRDGVLVPHVDEPPFLCPRSRDSPTPVPQCLVNLPKSERSRVSLARTQLVGQPGSWHVPIWEGFLQYLTHKMLPEIVALDPAHRLQRLAWVSVYHRISMRDLWRVVPSEEWPLAFLDSRAGIKALRRGDYRDETVYALPNLLAELVPGALIGLWSPQASNPSPLLGWVGEHTLVNSARSQLPDKSPVIPAIGDLGAQWLHQQFECVGVRFLESLWVGDPPTPQEVYQVRKSEAAPARGVDLFEKAATAPGSLTRAELRELPLWQDFVPFSPPFNQCCGYGRQLFNLTHPFVCAWIALAGKLLLAEQRRTMEPSAIGELKDAMRRLGGAIIMPDSWMLCSQATERLVTLADGSGLLAPTRLRGLARIILTFPLTFLDDCLSYWDAERTTSVYDPADSSHP